MYLSQACTADDQPDHRPAVMGRRQQLDRRSSVEEHSHDHGHRRRRSATPSNSASPGHGRGTPGSRRPRRRQVRGAADERHRAAPAPRHPRRPDRPSQAYYNTNTTTTTTTLTKQDVKDLNGNVLPSRGGWGAMLTRAANHENGDAYGPANNGGSANADYDPDGYDYIVNLPAGGTINVFDPGFCAMGEVVAGSIGTGDHWVGNQGSPSRPTTRSMTRVASPASAAPGPSCTPRIALREPAGVRPGQHRAGRRPPKGATQAAATQPRQVVDVPGREPAAGQYAIKVQTPRRIRQTDGVDQRRHERREHVRAARPGRRLAADLRQWADGGLQQPAGRRAEPAVLPGAGRQADRPEQDDAARHLRPGRCRGRGHAPDPEPERRRPERRDVQLHDGRQLPDGVSDNCSGTNVTQIETATTAARASTTRGSTSASR